MRMWSPLGHSGLCSRMGSGGRNEKGFLSPLLSLSRSQLPIFDPTTLSLGSMRIEEEGEKALINNQEKREGRAEKEQLSWTGAQSRKVGTGFSGFAFTTFMPWRMTNGYKLKVVVLPYGWLKSLVRREVLGRLKVFLGFGPLVFFHSRNEFLFLGENEKGNKRGLVCGLSGAREATDSEKNSTRTNERSVGRTDGRNDDRAVETGKKRCMKKLSGCGDERRRRGGAVHTSVRCAAGKRSFPLKDDS